MKKIGFIDYYVSEWHANNYPQWIKDASQKLGLEYEVAYAWAEKDVSLVDGKTTDEWCKEMGVERCNSIAELCEKADYILILAPSDPDKHLGYAQEALKCGKHTYIDKTFAPDLATAEKIFALGKQYNTVFFSSSALRFAAEHEGKKDALCVCTTGGGGNLPEYIIHQAEMIVRLMGVGATSVTAEKLCDKITLRVAYADGRSAQMTYAPSMPFTTTVTTREGKTTLQVIRSDFFATLMEEILKFYESGTPCFDAAETLEVMKIRQWAVEAFEKL